MKWSSFVLKINLFPLVSLVLNRTIPVSITHKIYSSFDEGLEVKSIFLDIAKAFDKVWHDGIIFKLTQNGISGNLLNLFRDFLNERKQPVILNGQFSTWKNVSPGVPQGSILVLYCFQFTLTI